VLARLLVQCEAARCLADLAEAGAFAAADVRDIEDGGGMGWYAAARATMAFLPSGWFIERPASPLERHQMATFHKLTRSHLTL
jgi:hypothetical protein